jgi:ferritin-like metal-binding protein YciE
MSMKTFEDLFIRELKDLYSVEKQLTRALPKMAKAASSESLKEAFHQHLQQTKQQMERLEQIFELLGKRARSEKCVAMEGLIEEGQEIISEDIEGSVKDAALIGAAQRVEHYEIAAYGTARTFAHHLGHSEAESLLDQTLREEKETDEKLTRLAESEVNVQAEQVTS